jgi:hypothetical protein
MGHERLGYDQFSLRLAVELPTDKSGERIVERQ